MNHDVKLSLNRIATLIAIYIHTHRFIRLGNFFHLLIGFIFTSGLSISVSHIFIFIKIFLIHGMLMYGGIYACNNAFDYTHDYSHRFKRRRLWIRMRVSRLIIAIDAIALIGLSILLGTIYLPTLVIFQFFFIGLNLIYTMVLKKIDQVIGTLIISSTHPARFALGVVVAGGQVMDPFTAYVMIWCGLVLAVTFKIEKEHTSTLFDLSTIRVLCAIGFSAAFILIRSSSNSWILWYYVFHYGSILLLASSKGFLNSFLRRLWLT